MWWKMKKKPDPKPERVVVPRDLTEAEEAAKIARVRALTEEAKAAVARLRAIKSAVEAEGGVISIHADENIRYVGFSSGLELDPVTYRVESSYTAKS